MPKVMVFLNGESPAAIRLARVDIPYCERTVTEALSLYEPVFVVT